MRLSIASKDPTRHRAGATATLVAGGVSAVLASACCLGPLVLLVLGFSGAWIGNLTTLEPYRPIFLMVASSALAAAGWRIWRSPGACEPGRACAVPTVRRRYKLAFWAVAILVLIAVGFPFVAPLFY